MKWPKIYTKDYSIDVEAVMRDTKERLQRELGIQDSDAESTSDSGKEMQKGST